MNSVIEYTTTIGVGRLPVVVVATYDKASPTYNVDVQHIYPGSMDSSIDILELLEYNTIADITDEVREFIGGCVIAVMQ